MSKKVLAERYELLERKGNGGMAVVYKGKDCLLNRYVAIKILKPEFIRDPKFIDNFRRESQAAAKLTDTNIVSVYDVGQEGNIYYIVMELMEGDSLGEIIQYEAPLSEERTIQIARQIASGLSSAHKKKIVHRDIKPHNILLSADGVAKIADFGIAKAVSGATVVNSSTTVMGSVHYLSPEQAKGGYVDARSDLYSLGIVIYEMLTGNVPFDGDNAVTVAMLHISNDVPAPSLVNPAVSAVMDHIVRKMTARNPADRYSSADEVIQALDDALNGIHASAEGATRVYGINDFPAGNPSDQYDDGYGRSIPDDQESDGFYEQGTGQPGKVSKGSGGSYFQKNDQEKKNKNKKNGTRRAKVLGVILALICAVPLSILLLHAVNNLGEDTVAVPDVLGMTEEKAARKLEDKGLEYELGTNVDTEEYEEGTVAGVDPKPGTHVKEGFTVTLQMARNDDKKDDSDKVDVPGVTRMTLSKARTVITDEGLKVGDVKYEYSNSVDEECVIRQDPGEGKRVKLGTSVDLTVSRGKDHSSVQVPNLMGMTRSQASEALERVGLTLGNVTEEYSSSTIGTVMRQGVKYGTTVEKGSAVDISLSKGRQSESSGNGSTVIDNDSSDRDSSNTDSTDNNNNSSSGNENSSSNSSSDSNNSSSSESRQNDSSSSNHDNSESDSNHTSQQDQDTHGSNSQESEDDNSSGVVDDEEISAGSGGTKNN